MNKITKLPYLIAILLITGITASACLPFGPAIPTMSVDQLQTAAAQTLQVLVTQAVGTATAVGPAFTPTEAAPAFTATSLPTSTPIPPTVTPFPTPIPPTATAITRCDWATYISDVTIPDGTTIGASTPFTKTWRLKNIGTCSWTTAYELVFIRGSQMGAATTKLAANVAPGQTIDVSVNLVAPDAAGSYRGYWMLRNAAGAIFGIGAQADGAFYVDIKVPSSAFTAYSDVYNFAVGYCSAAWSSGAGALACPGTIGDSNGYVVKLDAPNLENGSVENKPTLLTHPQDTTDGYITGIYPAFNVVKGDRFQAVIGCQYNSSNCNVLFKLEYLVSGSSSVQPLASWNEVYDKTYRSVDVDLSSLAGKAIQFILTVQANGAPTADDALWFMPRLVRPYTFTGASACSLVSQTPADNTQVVPGYDFDVNWTVKNIGSATWGKNSVDFIYLSGTKMHKFLDGYDLSADVAPTGTIKLGLDMLAPASAGTYTETWGLVEGSNIVCTVTLTIKVK